MNTNAGNIFLYSTVKQREKMKNLIEKLIKLKNKYPLEDYFVWDIPSNVPIEIPNTLHNIYIKNIYLKEKLKTVLNDDKNLTNYYWIIQEWGGIKSFKQTQNNDEKIIKFKQQLEKKKLTKDTFERISSFSKIASFLEPDKYAIYDSRVIYSLNWLLFNYTQNKELYPQPLGRNKELIQYDMTTIFNLSKQNYSYRTYKEAYFDYCDLMIMLSKAVYNDFRPYQMEMLLFILAPIEIIEDIKKNVTVNINNV